MNSQMFPLLPFLRGNQFLRNIVEDTGSKRGWTEAIHWIQMYFLSYTKKVHTADVVTIETHFFFVDRVQQFIPE